MSGSKSRGSQGARSGGSDRGFTLLEVLIAFAILAVAMGAILQAFSQGLRVMTVAEKHVVATLLAKTKLAEVGTAIPLEDGEYGGVFESDLETPFEWRIVIEPFVGEEGGEAEFEGLRIFQVAVEVGWEDRFPARLVTLRTARTGP